MPPHLPERRELLHRSVLGVDVPSFMVLSPEAAA